MFKIEFNAAAQIAALNNFEKTQLPFALVLAATKAAKLGQQDLSAQLAQNLDTHTPFTLKAGWVKPAKKRDFPNVEASFGIKTAQAKYLEPQFAGGARAQKPFEVKLGSASYYARPVNVPRDAYGNVPKSTLLRILAAAKTAKSGVFVNDAQTSIVAREGSRLTVLYALDSASPSYTPKLNLRQTAQLVEKALPELFEQALNQAIQTAKL